MNVKFEKTKKGEVAILPRAEYEALVAKAAEAEENIGTARIVARARKEIDAGAPLIPIEIVERIAAGENAIRALRDWKGLTQAQLARASELGQGYISDLENGRRKGTIDALVAISAALAVPLDLLAP